MAKKKKNTAVSLKDIASTVGKVAIGAQVSAKNATKIADTASTAKASTAKAGKSKVGGKTSGGSALKKSSTPGKNAVTQDQLQKTWMEKALSLYKTRNSDAQFDRNYFESYYNTDEGRKLFEATRETATPMQAAQNITAFIKLQSGMDYRAAQDADYNNAPGKQQFEANDAINKNVYLNEANSWMPLVKAGEQDVQQILDYWGKELDSLTDNSRSKARLQERYDELKSWAGNNYSSFAGKEYTDYYNQYARKKQELQMLGGYNSGVDESEKATALSALEWMSTGGDPVAIVENDATLRKLVDYDDLARKYRDPFELGDEIMRSLTDYSNRANAFDPREEQIQNEITGIEKQMAAAKDKRDRLETRENYKKLENQAWTINAASKYSVPEYEYKTIIHNEEGFGEPQYIINEPTLAQIIGDPEGVEAEWAKTRASIGEVGAGNAVNLINEAKLMTPAERQLYKALYADKGEKAAQEYYDSMQDELQYRVVQQAQQRASEFQRENALLANLHSIATVPLATIGRIAAWLEGEDQNSVLNEFGVYTNTIRQQTREDIDSPILRGAYDVGMAVVDNAMAGLLAGGYAQWLQALGALGSGYMESMEQTGGDVDRARLTGALEGLWEYATEKISWGELENTGSVNGIADATKYILKNIATEGLEEGTSGVLGDISGAIIEGDDNEIRQRIKYYRENGYSAQETAKIVAAEQLKEIGYEMLIGGATGGVLSGGNVVSSIAMQNDVDIATGRQIEQTGNISEVLKAGMESTDKAVKRISERLMEKLNLTDASKPVLPNDAQTSAELQFVAEGISEEQRAADIAKQQANNEARTEAQMRELDRKEARQLGKVYNKVMQVLDVAVEKDAKKLGKTLQSKLKEYGENHIQQVTQAIAEVVIEGENASKEAVDIAEAAAMRDGAIKTVFEAYKQDAARLREFIEKSAKPRAQQAMQELPARMQEAQQSEDAQTMPEAAQEGNGSISYTTETGDVHRGEIEGFAMNEGGGMDAVIDGERVPVDNLVVDDGDRESLIRRAAGLQDAEAAKLMYDSYERGQDMSAYAKSFETAYHYGEIALDEKRSRLLKGAKGVTDAQFAAAYAAGAAQAAAQPRQSASTSGGKVSFAEGLRERMGELDSRQQSAIDAMSRLAEETGTFNVEFFESQADENGSYMAWENGSYDPTTNTLRFDVNAGKNSETDVSRFAILRTASHELTHYMKAHNPEGFRQLLNYVAENLYNDSENAFDDLVELKMEQQGLSYAAAAEEVVSDGSEMMMRDSTAVQQFAQRNMSLFKKVKSWLANFVESVKRAFHGVSAQSIEARMLKNAQEIQNIWDDALVGAMENVRKGGTKSENANAGTETDGVKYSKRSEDSEAASIRDQVRNNIGILNEAKTVKNFSVEVPNANNRAELLNWASKVLENTGYEVEREGFGTISFDRKRLKTAISYVKRSSEIAAIVAVPDVLEKGIQIGKHENHKGRGYSTYTFAAPVVANGERGNMAVVVIKTTGNYYRAHRIFMPDGSDFTLGENRNTESGPSGGVSKDTSIQSTNSVSDVSIAQDGKSVKASERTDAPSDREILAQAFESVAANDAEREMLAKYQSQIETLDAKQAELKNVRARIEYLTKNTLTKDAAYKREMAGLRSKERALANKVNATDKTLIEMEHAKPLQDVVARESTEYAKKKVRESLKITREHRDAVELRRKIRNLADDFDRKLLKPTNTSYIPKEMARMVVAMRELVDVNGKRKSESARAKIDQIKEAYQKYKDDPQFAYAYDPTINEMLGKLKTEARDTDIYHMDKATLQDAYEVMKAVRKQVSDAVKLKSVQLQAVKMQANGRDANIFDVGEMMYHETMEAAPLLRGKMSDYLQWQLTPDKFFSRLAGYAKNSAWEAVGKSFRDGTQRRMEIQREAQEHFAKWLNSKEADQLNSTKEKDMIDIGLRDEHGDTIKITRGMMLEAYMHLSSEDNAAGFMYGGFSVPNLKKYYAGKVSESYGTGSINATGTAMELAELQAQLRSKTLTEDEKAEIGRKMDEAEERGRDRIATMKKDIEGKLTEWDRGLIKAIHEWNDGRSRDLINEVTMDIYGTKRAGVKNYYPIHRDRAFVNTDFDSISRNVNLENWGSLKDRVPSRAPILLGDVLYTMDNSVNQMSRYVGYARAQRDFNKLYNIRMPGMAGSVKKAVEKKFGTGERGIGVSGTQYIENYIGNITGGRASESDFLQAIRRNLPRATMSANLRVGFSQFSAITKAAQEVGWGNLAKGMAKGGFRAIFDGKEQERLAKQNVWFWTRRQGEGGEREFADMKGGSDPISKAWNWVDDKTGGWLLNLNQKIDVATTAPMWYAAKEWTKQNSNAREGTAEFDAIANEKYTDILRNTQAANTISEMSDLQRGNKGGAMSILTMYKSEAFANFNIMYDAIVRYRKYAGDLKAGKNGVTKADVKQAKLKIANGVTSVMIGSSLLNAVIKLAVNAIFSNMNNYRDDEDEISMESIAKEIGLEMLDDATGMVTFGGEAYDLLAAVIGGENYDPPSLAALDELSDVAKTAVNLVNKDDASMEDYVKAAEKTVMSVGTIFGIPIENTKRQVKGIINTVQDIYAGDAFRYEASVDRSNSTNMHRLAEASLNGDKTKWDKVYKEYSEAYFEDEGKELTEKEFISKFKQYIGKQYKKGELTKEEATELLKERTDINTEDDIYWKFDEWDYAIENGSTDGYSEYTDLAEAIASKNTKEIDESIAYYTSHGYKEKDVLSQIETRARKMYADGTLNWEDGLAILIKYCNSSSKDYDNEVKQYWLKREWDYAKEHDGKLGDYSKYSDFYAAVETGEDASEYVEELLTHAESKKKARSSAMSSINSRYRTQYIDAVEAGKSEEAETIMNYALDALEYFGKSRSSQITYIKKKWKDND